MKLRCAILDDYQQVALSATDWSRILDKVEVKSIDRHIDQPEELVEQLADCDIVVIMRERTPFRASLLAKLPRLKLLVTTGMRNASIDLTAAASQGVTVCGTGGAGNATAELTWALILGLARNIVQEHNAIRSGQWQSTIGSDLYGKTLGVLGLGKLGSKIAKFGQAFGMDVVAWSQNLTKERADEIGVRLAASKEELLESSDFVSIHLVLSDRTRGMIGAGELKRMRPSAYLINTSRAPIVDQAALAEALQSGWIAGAAVDVFEVEPLPQDDIYRSLPNLLTTPHIGYVSRANYEAFYKDVVEDIEAYLSGSPVRTLS
ncbi:D-2-hydroxyacid dehydrogenase family protein [Paenibacillus aceris]|uniref:Phosphoglycerate dehydrogenase-like enzyme n=1 Tax=Paenibacillus aceris TaxID=869555 RepID=A0ABS4I001_9BACL|nr:D-2-hydroxyacid dehydrogenase family protein [Paenibacillus aceris]MBP1964242.1 phosphoglycerate dehydrogenase-like enzyme [Paenibacillus aceris]NHW36565.1 D-2-hydroxyacid dehydrogenase family protein [Paenibacillus aceris]